MLGELKPTLVDVLTGLEVVLFLFHPLLLTLALFGQLFLGVLVDEVEIVLLDALAQYHRLAVKLGNILVVLLLGDKSVFQVLGMGGTLFVVPRLQLGKALVAVQLCQCPLQVVPLFFHFQKGLLRLPILVEGVLHRLLPLFLLLLLFLLGRCQRVGQCVGSNKLVGLILHLLHLFHAVVAVTLGTLLGGSV